MDGGTGFGMTDIHDYPSQPWWKGVEPPVRQLASAIVRGHAQNPDDMVLPYDGARTVTPAGTATYVRGTDLCPLWTCYVNLARLALATKDEMAVAETIGEAEVFSDVKTADQQWREDHGLAPPDGA
jgi:hypothetical protein